MVIFVFFPFKNLVYQVQCLFSVLWSRGSVCPYLDEMRGGHYYLYLYLHPIPTKWNIKVSLKYIQNEYCIINTSKEQFTKLYIGLVLDIHGSSTHKKTIIVCT